MARTSKKQNNSIEPVDVPLILTDDRIDGQAKLMLIPPFAEELGLNFETSLHFINGLTIYLDHMTHENSSYFSFKLDEVEVIEVEVSGNNGKFVLGKKARLHFKAKGYKTDKITEQYIDTEWIEFNGFSPETQIFQVSLANKLYEAAKELEGENVAVRKHYFENDEGTGFRYLAHIRKGRDYDNDSDDSGDDDKSSRRRGSSSGRRNKSSWRSDVDKMVEKLDTHNDVTDDDLKMFYGLEEADRRDIDSDVAEALGIKKNELTKVDFDEDEIIEYAVSLFIKNIGTD